MKQSNKICEICQKPFYSKVSIAKYCPKCREEGNKQKRKAYYQATKEQRSKNISQKRQTLKQENPKLYEKMLADEKVRRERRRAKNPTTESEYQRQYNARKRLEMGDEAYREYHRKFEQSINKVGSKAWKVWAKENDIDAYNAYAEKTRKYQREYYLRKKKQQKDNE